MNRKARLLAFYLPQFHPIPENDAWWGPGFTEWTNVVKGRPLFRGHYQPRLPTDLGFYDLRVPEVREAQAELAKRAGIEGFIYYHYWFGGKRLLERPFIEVVRSGRPNFPFCLCWANQTWSGIWHGEPHRVLVEQTYPGQKDNEQHFTSLVDAFHDPRYVRVEGRPVFVIYRPLEIPDSFRFLCQWRDLAAKNHLPGMYFVAQLDPSEINWDYRRNGFDGAVIVDSLRPFRVAAWEVLKRRTAERGRSLRESVSWYVRDRSIRLVRRLVGRFRNVVRYEDALPFFLDWDGDSTMYPCVTPNWDNTPRSGRRGHVFHGSTPELYAALLRRAIRMVDYRPLGQRLVFVKSWNEWAEGNYLEPDERFGHEYLDVTREAVFGEGCVGDGPRQV